MGLDRNFTHDELLSMIVNQNSGIRTIKESENASPEDCVLDIIKVQPLRAKSTVFKAIVRVSNLIRSVISKQGDRLFMGCKTCKIYDFVYTLRCYNCQEFGHHSAKCNNAAACALCAGDHETRRQ